jgi:hypothetical protein
VSLASCIRAWRSRQPLHAEVTSRTEEQAGDNAFSRGAFEEAIAAYSKIRRPHARVKAKHGWCLAITDRFDAAAPLLTPATCGDSSAELAMLAVVLVGGWERNTLRGFKGLRDQEKATEATMEALVGRALAVEHPDLLAFSAYRSLVSWYRDREAALAVAERSCHHFPASQSFAQWRALLLRTLGRPSDEALDHLLALESAESTTTFRNEIFDTALELGRYDDAVAVLERARAAMAGDFETTAADRVAGALMLAYVDLRRALDADPAGARRAWQTLESMSADLTTTPANDLLRLAADKLRLTVAQQLGDTAGASRAALALLQRYWSDHSLGDYGLTMVSLAADGIYHEAELGDGAHAAEIADVLPATERDRWRLLLALLRSACQGAEDPEMHATIADLGPTLAPEWALSSVAESLMTVEPPRWSEAGRLFARHALVQERLGDSMTYVNVEELDAVALAPLVDGVVVGLQNPAPGTGGLLLGALRERLVEEKCYQPLQRLADAVATRDASADALFFGALARHELGQLAEARTLYEKVLGLVPGFRSAYWNLILIHQRLEDRTALERLLPAVTAQADKAGTEDWSRTLALARDTLSRMPHTRPAADARIRIQTALAEFPPLDEDEIDPSDLSLLEAASLLALLRASDMDHLHWTLAPMSTSAQPYEPTMGRFGSALLALASRGIVRIAEDFPLGAFDLQQDQVRYYVRELRWQVSARTLQLAAAIRDLARADWPLAWRQQAESLARDVAVEECIAYLEHLVEQRNLDAPERADARAVFRELLEHASASQCWYYIYSGVQKANDWNTKYHPSRDKVTARILKGIRELGDKAREKGWPTKHERIYALPRSHLAAALHDVLTRWGERAFEEPIRALTLDASAT